jgi:hypothetical protein
LKKNDASNMRGDCPGLDGGPVSAEHERRFTRQNREQGTVASSGVSDSSETQNQQNPEKGRATES